jgi:hypothetical protein
MHFMAELPRIVKVWHTAPGVSRVKFRDGQVREIVWRRYARPGTLLERLNDDKYSTNCRIIDRGLALEWPDGADWASEAVLDAGTPVKRLVGGPLFASPVDLRPRKAS